MVGLGTGSGLDHVPASVCGPAGPVLLAGDDAVTEHPGPEVFGKRRRRDGVRSTHSDTAFRWGHTWVIVSVLVKVLVAIRTPSSLPPSRT
jgi:hypothetical protein